MNVVLIIIDTLRQDYVCCLETGGLKHLILTL